MRVNSTEQSVLYHKRSRHYQGVIDTKQLPAGSIDYNKLNNSYIIFICEFDLFEKGWYFYSFEERCNEDYNLKLNDGTKKIFLNTKGNNYNGEPKELLEFLQYVKDTNQPQEFHSNRMKRLVKRVEEVRRDEEVEARYMTMLTLENELMEKGMQQGNISAIRKMLNKGLEPSQIADLLDEQVEYIEKIQSIILQNPSYSNEDILKEL